MKKKDAEDALLDQGMRRGFITFEELNEIFPAEYFPLEEIDRLLSCLEAHGVKVAEHPCSRKRRQQNRPNQKKGVRGLVVNPAGLLPELGGGLTCCRRKPARPPEAIGYPFTGKRTPVMLQGHAPAADTEKTAFERKRTEGIAAPPSSCATHGSLPGVCRKIPSSRKPVQGHSSWEKR